MGALRQYTRAAAILAAFCCALAAAGCQIFPDKLHQPVYHNPFPQLHKVAILPFYNQSAEPTVDGEAMAMAYYNELQTIQGFEVMPVGVAKRMLDASGFEPRTAQDFQRLARLMNVDAVIIGSVTEYTPYYPPRLGLSVDWYAANPSFHPVPAGYGLPWGTAEEEYIPSTLVTEAEFSLAKEQLKTQTPEIPPEENRAQADVSPAFHEEIAVNELRAGEDAKPPAGGKSPVQSPKGQTQAPGVKGIVAESPSDLPADWPDPRGFIPPAPTPTRPAPRPQHDPIISHTHVYHGHDADFTQRLENYFYCRDDARFGGYEGYLQRPDDFTRFCCHLHVTETLAARGGAGESRVVYRWPLRRYER
ncbi:MAG: hypothetical protein ACKVP0_27025 [Pirellulaceae bacterium]